MPDRRARSTADGCRRSKLCDSFPTAPLRNRTAGFYMGGGGGTDSSLVRTLRTLRYWDTRRLAPTPGTTIPLTMSRTQVGTASFSIDPQARVDFAYNTYDEVARTGKKKHCITALPSSRISSDARKAAAKQVISQKFPTYFDGIVKTAACIPPRNNERLLHQPVFAGLAKSHGRELNLAIPR